VIDVLLDLATLLLLLGGVVLGLAGAWGVLRFPDFYTRLHASGVTDTLSAAMMLGGLMLQAGFSLVTLKLAFILLFLWHTSPAASHALARAAIRAGWRPRLSDEGEPPSKT
jgi:multicomponent Na+:H+ antiporter subunit G